MLSINGPGTNSKSALDRRQFLRVGAAGSFGLSLPNLLRAQEATKAANTTEDFGAAAFGRAKRCLLVVLFGGASQLDTFDMKPDAPKEVRGPLKSIPTNVEGIRISELLPRIARHADKFKIVRTVTHEHAEHSAGLCTMITGTPYPRATASPVTATPRDHPHLGSIYAKHFGWKDGMPPFVAIPGEIGGSGAGKWPGQDAGFLGATCDPVTLHGDKKKATFQLPEVELPPQVDSARLTRRISLVSQLDRSLRSLDNDSIRALDTWNQRAYSMVGSNKLLEAVDLDREKENVRDHYGRHLWGQGLLMCRRLLEAGLPLATIYWFDPEPAGAGGGEFDSHGRIYHHYPNRLCPPADRGIAALFDDMSQRGLLDDTLVVVMGEFGRTPKINVGAGRDHWPGTQSVLLAGAGISGGQIYGRTDNHAGFPVEDGVPSESLAQTILHLVGVPSNFDLYDPEGRPIPACRGEVIPGLFA